MIITAGNAGSKRYLAAKTEEGEVSGEWLARQPADPCHRRGWQNRGRPNNGIIYHRKVSDPDYNLPECDKKGMGGMV